ncbi:ABC transporter permease subunit [Peribacillus acanthi]|uniref:ABC transporter permease subunit n=1 Tax=Peribacillus acanthi TaxID=2171554 RepID=UPI000D3E4615|nr:ABC transporter permease subunit [Peribacillus acanthi]
MNVYIREMKAYRKSLILWCIGMLAMIGSGMAKYAGFKSSGQSMNELMSQMPQSLQALMGIGSLDISTASGYYGLLFLYLLLMATLQAVMIGATIISKEEREKTVEFLFVKPISRKKIILSKVLAALTNVSILTLFTWIVCILFVGLYSEGEEVQANIGITILGMYILQLLFLSIGSAIAAISQNPKKASSLSTAILLVMFILSVAIDLNESMKRLKFLTPFKYFEAKNVMYGGGLDLIFILISFILVGLLMIVTFTFFEKRDLKV